MNLLNNSVFRVFVRIKGNPLWDILPCMENFFSKELSNDLRLLTEASGALRKWFIYSIRVASLCTHTVKINLYLSILENKFSIQKTMSKWDFFVVTLVLVIFIRKFQY